jgi:hypothetical protein
MSDEDLDAMYPIEDIDYNTYVPKYSKHAPMTGSSVVISKPTAPMVSPYVAHAPMTGSSVVISKPTAPMVSPFVAPAPMTSNKPKFPKGSYYDLHPEEWIDDGPMNMAVPVTSNGPMAMAMPVTGNGPQPQFAMPVT